MPLDDFVLDHFTDVAAAPAMSRPAAAAAAAAKKGGPTDEQLRKLFDKLDSDGSGYLDGDEVIVIVSKHFDRHVTEEEVAVAIEEMERAGGGFGDTADGRVTFEEFKTWWRSNGPERLHARLRAKAMASERESSAGLPGAELQRATSARSYNGAEIGTAGHGTPRASSVAGRGTPGARRAAPPISGAGGAVAAGSPRPGGLGRGRGRGRGRGVQLPLTTSESFQERMR
eukprot:SAG22_NODE_487_length_9870_cov_13.118821_1_plen_227_part_10